jgi:transposase
MIPSFPFPGFFDTFVGVSAKGPVNNVPKDIAKLLATLLAKTKDKGTLRLCVASTAPYGRPPIAACLKRGVPISQVNPKFVKAHAESNGVFYKTDKVDAWIIRDFAEHKNPPPVQPLDATRTELRELHLVRDGYDGDLTRQKNLLASVTCPVLRRRLQATIRGLRRLIDGLEAQIRQAVEQDPAVAGLAGALCGITGVGLLTASKTLAHVPELGTLGRRSSAYLAGLAPMPKDSGTLSSPRVIKGGRWHVRNGLYMAALSAAVHNDVLRELYQRLVSRGKPRKVALTAVMRKLFAHMDRVARKHLNPPVAPAPVPPPEA